MEGLGVVEAALKAGKGCVMLGSHLGSFDLLMLVHQTMRGRPVTVMMQVDPRARLRRIVGIDETEADRGWVSWLSPIARALLNARLGEGVRFKLPSGEEELEILRIEYE